MPVSVFKEPHTAKTIQISEISGVQLNRLLVLATRVERQDNSAQHVVREMIESEFARLSRQGVFSFAGADKERP